MEFKPEKPSPETAEPKEARKEVMKEAKNGRLDLGKVVLRDLMSVIINGIPFAGSVKMGREIVRNKAMGGKELKSTDRIMRGVIISSNLIFYILLGLRLSMEDPEVAKEIYILMGESTLLATVLTVVQGSIEGKRDVQEVVKEKFKLDFPQFLKNVRQFAEKYDIESLKEPLSICEKIIEEYGYDNIGNLIIRANDEKLDANN